jgi:hypothetical protein
MSTTKLQVLRAIIGTIPVDVVNLLPRFKGPAQFLLHHQPVLPVISTISTGDHHVPIVDPPTTLPTVVGGPTRLTPLRTRQSPHIRTMEERLFAKGARRPFRPYSNKAPVVRTVEVRPPLSLLVLSEMRVGQRWPPSTISSTGGTQAESVFSSRSRGPATCLEVCGGGGLGPGGHAGIGSNRALLLPHSHRPCVCTQGLSLA